MLLPRSDLRPEGHCVIDPAVETLSFEHVEFNLGYIQPTAVLGDVMKLEPIEVRVGFVLGAAMETDVYNDSHH
jgi:hypothetical protein